MCYVDLRPPQQIITQAVGEGVRVANKVIGFENTASPYFEYNCRNNRPPVYFTRQTLSCSWQHGLGEMGGYSAG